jgi:hypothetical protein
MSDAVDSFLAHYGVPGMKWGRRKDGSGGSSKRSLTLVKESTGEHRTIIYNPSKVTVSADHQTIDGSRREAKRVQAQIDKHGRDLEAHPDARAATGAKNVADTKGLAHVGNKELQAFITRTNLEQQYAKLTAPQMTAGQKFISNVLGNSGKQLANQYAQEYTKKAVANLVKNAK